MSAIPAERPMPVAKPQGRAPLALVHSTDDELLRMEALAFRYGEAYDSYLVVEHDRRYFWSQDRSGVIGYIQRGKYVHVVGGLLAEPAGRPALLAEFMRFAPTIGAKSVAFYNVMDEELPLFAGFEISKCGEEPIVDLRTTTWSGKPYEWLRRQEHFCQRQGLTCVEVSAADDFGGLAGALREVAAEHAANTTRGHEMSYFVSRFDLAQLGRRRIFVAMGRGGVEGFVTCNPCLGGRMWAIETYRRRPEATRGVIPFIMMSAMRQMKAEGVERVSLSLVPGLRADEKRAGDSALFRFGQALWWRSLNWMYDMRGIYHYKSRFRPDFRPMYIAATPKMTVFAIKSMFDAWGMFDIAPGRLIASITSKLSKARVRKTLAEPKPSKADEHGGAEAP